MFGIPFGLLLLTTVAEPVVKAVLAAVIIAFSAYRLVGRSRFELQDDRLAWFFGFGAGVLGGAYGMNGPPLVAYGALRRWSPEQFRATLQGYFLPASLVGMAGYWVAGLWVPAVTRYYLCPCRWSWRRSSWAGSSTVASTGAGSSFYVHIGLVRHRDDPPGSIRLGVGPDLSGLTGEENRLVGGLENRLASAQPGRADSTAPLAGDSEGAGERSPLSHETLSTIEWGDDSKRP